MGNGALQLLLLFLTGITEQKKNKVKNTSPPRFDTFFLRQLFANQVRAAPKLCRITCEVHTQCSTSTGSHWRWVVITSILALAAVTLPTSFSALQVLFFFPLKS
jgi:hypothetical protein